jgi:hypothetical protein
MKDVKYPELYRVIKIFDFRTKKPCYTKRTYGQACISYVPTLKAQELLKMEGREIHRHAGDYPFDELWHKQLTLEPVVGFPVLFISIKPDAGYFRCAEVVAVEKYEGVEGFSLPRMIIQTVNSLYLVEVDD